MAVEPKIAWPIYNALAPSAEKGPRVLRVPFDFTNVQSIDFDFEMERETAQLEFVQTLFIDNSQNGSKIQIIAKTTQQILWVDKNTQAYLPVLANNTAFQLNTAGGVIVPVHFINVPLPAIVWSTAP